MKNFFKKLSFVLAIAMVLTSVAPATAMAAEVVPAKNVKIKVDGEKVDTINLTVGETETVKIGLPVKKAFEGQKSTYKTWYVVDGNAVEVVRVGNKNYEVTAVEAGEATITINAAETKELAKAGEGKSATVKVVVVGQALEVAQKTNKQFTLKFATAEAAKAAKEATEKYLADGLADVTEAKDIIKVWEVLGAEEEAARIPVGYSIDKKDATLLHVTMSTDLLEDTKYVVRYLDKEVSFVAVPWVPEKIEIKSAYTPDDVLVDGGVAELSLVIYGKNDVIITEKASMLSVVDYVDAAVNAHTDYSVVGDEVNFYTTKVSARVKATLTWYGNDGTIVEKETVKDVKPEDLRQYKILAAEVIRAGVDAAAKRDFWKQSTIDAKFASTDVNPILFVTIGVDANNDGDYTDDIIRDGYGAYATLTGADDATDNEMVTYVSSNVDKLNIDELDGTLYSTKETTTTAGVHVYYKDKYVGTVPVKVEKTRRLAAVYPVATPADQRLCFNTIDETGTYFGFDTGELVYTYMAFDQFGKQYNDVTFTVTKTNDYLTDLVTATKFDYGVTGLPENETDTQLYAKNDEYMTAGFGMLNLAFSIDEVAAVDEAKVAKTMQYKVVVADEQNNVTLPAQVLSFRVKNTTDDVVTSKRFSVNPITGVATILGYSAQNYPVLQYYFTTTDVVVNDADAFDTADAKAVLVVDTIALSNNKKVSATAVGTVTSYTSIKIDTKLQYTGVDKNDTKERTNVILLGADGNAVADATPIDAKAFWEDGSVLYLADGKYQYRVYAQRWNAAKTERLAYGSPVAFVTVEHKNVLPNDVVTMVASRTEEVDPFDVANAVFRFSIQEFVDHDYNPVTPNVYLNKTNLNSLDGRWAFAELVAGAFVDGSETPNDYSAAFALSYIEHANGDITFRNLYRQLSDGHVVVVPINKTIDTGYQQ